MTRADEASPKMSPPRSRRPRRLRPTRRHQRLQARRPACPPRAHPPRRRHPEPGSGRARHQRSRAVTSRGPAKLKTCPQDGGSAGSTPHTCAGGRIPEPSTGLTATVTLDPTPLTASGRAVLAAVPDPLIAPVDTTPGVDRRQALPAAAAPVVQ
jgi:hypothetical protein